MSARYLIPIRRGRITGSVDLNLSGYRVRFLHPVDEAVVRMFRVPIEDIYDHCRGKDVDDARTALIVLRKEYSGAGDIRLGQQIGRDHGSIWHARRRSRDLEQTDPCYRDKLNATRKALGL